MSELADDDLEDLYEHAPCGNFSATPDGTIVKINATLLSWLHLTREQILGTKFQDLLTMPGRIFHDTHYRPLLALQGYAREIAFDLHRAPHPPLPTMITTVSKTDASGRAVLYRSTVFDASVRRSFERELIAQRRAAEQEAAARAALIAMLSHDIRSPLGNILMSVEMLRESDTVETRTRYLDLVDRAATSMLDLVNAILDHSRLDAGAAAWDPQPIDLRALLVEIASIHAVSAESKGIELRTSIDAALPERVMVDRYKLGQIVNNLVSNALKFTKLGHVSVELRALNVHHQKVEVELRVSDTGIGIASEKLETIFEEYTQASKTTARDFGGTGLGLSIARRLAALAGSQIRVESTVGVGSTFSCVLRLPIAADRNAVAGAG